MTLATDLAVISADRVIFHSIIHGIATATVVTEGGVVPSLANILAKIGTGASRGNWVTATAYALNDLVVNGGIAYRCIVAHTSGTFATDLAAGKWVLQSTDASTIPVTATGTTTARTLAARFGETLNVKDFGAVGDGTTDDTTAIQAAFTAVAAGGGAVYFPPGTYILTQQITCNNKSVYAWGAGAGVSILRWKSTATSEGISYTDSVSSQRVTLKQLSLLTEKVVTGTAISSTRTAEASAGAVQDRMSSRLCVEDVIIRGTGDNATNGWLYGAVLVDTMHATFTGVHFSGYDAGAVASPQSEAMLSLSGVNHPVEFVVDKCWCFYSKAGIKMRDVIEGVFVTNSTFVAVNYGVDWLATGNSPQLAFINNHVAAYIDNIKIINGSQSTIIGNVFYHRDDAVADGCGVLIDSGVANVVKGNVFVKTSSALLTWKAVYVTGTANGTAIVGNLVQNANYGIDLDASTLNTFYRDNHFIAYVVKVRDSSANNRKPSGWYASARRTAVQSIPNSTLTAMIWQTEVNDDFGGIALGTDATRITIPAGIDFVDIDAGIIWGLGTTAQRRIEIWKNGAVLQDAAKVHSTASDNNAFGINVRMVPVVAGDYLQVKVLQDTGGALDVNSDEATYFRVIVAVKDN